jgi:hypothetical protein
VGSETEEGGFILNEQNAVGYTALSEGGEGYPTLAVYPSVPPLAISPSVPNAEQK